MAADDDVVVCSFKDLLRQTGSRNWQELSELVDDRVELDGWVPPPSEQLEPGSLLVRVDNRGVSLTYPFTLSELWETLADLEDDIEASWRLDELYHYVNLRFLETRSATLVIKYLESFYPFDRVSVDLGRSGTTEAGYGTRLLVRDVTVTGSPTVARVVPRPAVQLRLGEQEVRDLVHQVRLCQKGRDRNFAVECDLTSMASVKLAIRLTKRALTKRRATGGAIH